MERSASRRLRASSFSHKLFGSDGAPVKAQLLVPACDSSDQLRRKNLHPSVPYQISTRIVRSRGYRPVTRRSRGDDRIFVPCRMDLSSAPDLKRAARGWAGRSGPLAKKAPLQICALIKAILRRGLLVAV